MSQTQGGRRHLRPLVISFALVAVFMVVETLAGILTGSLALVSDAGHMATDVLGLGMAIAAILAASRSGSVGSGRTYGLYRLEIIAALANAVLLMGVAGFVIWEAISRLAGPPEILAAPVLVVAVGGLVINLVVWRLLHHRAETSLNVKGAYMEVVADLVGSIGVIAAAVITLVTGWDYADPVVAGLIGLFILPRAWRLGGDALRILLQAAPTRLDLSAVQASLLAVPGVVDVHDLHVWTLTTEMDVASVHLTIEDGDDPHLILDTARHILEDEFAVGHATLQIEPRSHSECVEARW